MKTEKYLKTISGKGVSPGISRGYVKIIRERKDYESITSGQIIVAFRLNPELSFALMQAKGIISVRGGLNSHAAIVAREMGIPCIIDITNIRGLLSDGDFIEMDGSSGIIHVLDRKFVQVEFYLNAPCNNNCEFCYNANNTELPKGIANIYLYGKEPTLLQEKFLNLIKKIKNEHPGSKINIVTNGRMLAYTKFLESFKGDDIKFIIEFFSSSELLHNKITKDNSYGQTMKGIKNISEKYEFSFQIMVCPDNLDTLAETVRYLCENFKKKVSIYFPDHYFDINQINALLVESLKYCTWYRTDFEILNIPRCLLNKELHNSIEFRFAKMEKQKICDICKYNRECAGMLHSYSDKNCYRPIK